MQSHYRNRSAACDGGRAYLTLTPDPTPEPLRHSYSALDLMDLQRPEAIIEGIFHRGDILLLHGTEECFKSVFVMQMAENLCTATPFLGDWTVPGAWRVGLLETEMHPASMGDRLTKMFPDRATPANLTFMHDDLLKRWRRCSLEGKFRVISEWVRVQSLDIVILDTVNDFFRGKEDPSSETVAGKFFDELRNLGLRGAICVRHDRKKNENDSDMHSNERIRGSAEFKEDPEVILYLDRVDRRTHEVFLDVGKLRYGRKPEGRHLWFDAARLRLTPLPPVVAMMCEGPKTRLQLVEGGKSRFDISQSRVDDMLKESSSWLIESMEGHNKMFKINPLTVGDATWAGWLPTTWWGCSEKDIQPFVSVSEPLEEVVWPTDL